MSTLVILLSAHRSGFLKHPVRRWTADTLVLQRHPVLCHPGNVHRFELQTLAAVNGKHPHRVDVARAAGDLPQIALVAQHHQMPDALEQAKDRWPLAMRMRLANEI